MSASIISPGSTILAELEAREKIFWLMVATSRPLSSDLLGRFFLLSSTLALNIFLGWHHIGNIVCRMAV